MNLGISFLVKGTIKSNRDGVALIAVDNREISALTEIKDGKVDVFIRPENIILSKNPIRSSARNSFKGRITKITNLGPILNVELDDGLKAFITKQSAEEMNLKQDAEIYASFKATATLLIAMYRQLVIVSSAHERISFI